MFGGTKSGEVLNDQEVQQHQQAINKVLKDAKKVVAATQDEIKQQQQHKQIKEQQTKPEQETIKMQQPQQQQQQQQSGEEKQQQQKEVPNLTAEQIYDYYRNEIWPAIWASLPILVGKLGQDTKAWLLLASHKFLEFLLPAWTRWNQQVAIAKNTTMSNLGHLWEQTLVTAARNTDSQTNTTHNAVAEFMLSHFDTNGDGTISPSELINMTDIMALLNTQSTQIASSSPKQFLQWWAAEWPLMDWKVGVFMWRSFGGLLIVIALLSIMPGRLHRISGLILRWPILVLTYFLVTVELIVYVVIRLFIRYAEILIAKPKHRQLRKKMANAETYEDWYKYAIALDVSQKRDKWQRSVHDSTSYRYNWALIKQLREDMQHARANKGDSLEALAVLQQCTRKNVGGIMSEDLFSFTNTGEPKFIVKDFIDEVVNTLHWVTDEAVSRSQAAEATEAAVAKRRNSAVVEAKVTYEKRFEKKVRAEKDKIWKSLVGWATLDFHDPSAKTEKKAAVSEKASRPLQLKQQQSSGDTSKTTDNTSSSNKSPATSPEKPVLRERSGTNSSGENSASLMADYNSQGSGGAPLKTLPPGFHKEQMVLFLKRARAAYGRTALCLSGGAMMGLYHFGHLRGLMETDCLPNIISGTSAGSIVGALVATRTNSELRRDMTPEVLGKRMNCFARPWVERIKSVWKHGHLFSGEEWYELVKWFTCGDMTFEEAYRKTGRVFCITLASTTKKAPPVLINHQTAPHVVIASAVVASASVPGFVEPAKLRVKEIDGTVRFAGEETYFDGSIETDIPVNGLAEMLNCQFFVACQCNPHVVPFFFNAKGGVGRPSRWSSGEQEASWRGGFALAALEMYLKNDMKSKFIFLRDMEAAVGFTSTMMTQEFHGSTTIVPQVRLPDFFTLFSDPDPTSLEGYFQAGSVAAYQHAAMIRLHYRIADAIDSCLEKLGAVEVRGSKAKVSRRASFEVNEQISKAIAQNPNVHINNTMSPTHNMPAVITAALNERFESDDGSTSMSDDDSNY